MDLRDLINEYISKEVHSYTEKEKVSKLLLDDLKNYLEEEQLPYEINIKSLQINEGYREKLENSLLELLKKPLIQKNLHKNV